MKAVIVIHFAQKAGSSISWSTCVCNTNQRLGLFSFIQLNILSITGYRREPHSLVIMQEGSFSLPKIFHVKDLHTNTFLWERAECNSLFLLLCK